jgi:hypothetical protein
MPVYASLIENLRISCSCNVIGMFLTPRSNSRDFKTNIKGAFEYSTKYKKTIKDYTGFQDLADGAISEFRKKDMLFIPEGFNFNEYFVILTSHVGNLDNEAEFDVDDELDYTEKKSQHKLVKEFAKFNDSKKNNRIILEKFAEIIA